VSTLVATRDVPSEDVVAGRTRIADDHELAARYPDCWKRDVYSDSVHRGAGVPPVNGKPGQAENRRVLNKATQGPTRGTEVAAVALRPDGSRTRRDIDRVVLGKGMLTPTRSFERNGEKFVANVNPRRARGRRLSRSRGRPPAPAMLGGGVRRPSGRALRAVDRPEMGSEARALADSRACVRELLEAAVWHAGVRSLPPAPPRR
jgi:hypothetical protein